MGGESLSPVSQPILPDNKTNALFISMGIRCKDISLGIAPENSCHA
jgi:hypothetical protein